MAEKYRGEFGSSPTLLDDALASPALMAQLEASIPELNTRPANEKRYLGDLCKIDGVIHVWQVDRWCSLDEAMRQTYKVEA